MYLNLTKQQLFRYFDDYFKITVIIIAVATNSGNEMWIFFFFEKSLEKYSFSGRKANNRKGTFHVVYVIMRQKIHTK